MKDEKRICCILLGILCLFQLTSCGNKGTESVDGESIIQNIESNILKEMENANSEETLLAKYDKVAFRYTYTYADGVVDSEYCYKDADRYVRETDYGVEIDENGDVYGFSDEIKRAYRYAFVEDAYTDYKNEYSDLDYYVYSEEETILSQEEKDGIITLHTNAIADKDSVEECAGYYFFEEGVVDHFEMSYKVDAQTNEIIECILFAIMSDGTEQTVVESERILNPEKYVVDEQLKELIFGGEQRTVTITAYPGSARETVYTQKVSKGSGFQLYFPEGGQLYADAECTTKFEGGSDLTVDIQLYYK